MKLSHNLQSINSILGDYNVKAQVLGTKGEIGYLIVDVESAASEEVKTAIKKLPSSIKTRVLY